jgi:hypothetical protein
MPSERYDEDGELILTPRDMGVMMHRVFQNADSYEDVLVGIEQLRTSSVLSEMECEKLTQTIE